MARGHAWQGGHAWHTVNERAVHILLECILFSLTFSVIEATGSRQHCELFRSAVHLLIINLFFVVCSRSAQRYSMSFPWFPKSCSTIAS